MAFPQESHVAWKVCITLVQVLAMASTAFRISYRIWRRRTWWDDWVVVIPLLSDATFLILMWLRFNREIPNPYDKVNPFYSFWVSSLLYFSIIWISRVCLSLSLARIFPPGDKSRIIAFVLAILCGLAFVACVILMTVTCDLSERFPWEYATSLGCLQGIDRFHVIGAITVGFDFLGDSILVICPLIMFWRIKLPSRQRRLILIAFSASVMTLLAAIVFCVFWYGDIDLGPDKFFLRVMTSQLATAISLFVCNFQVVATFIYASCLRNSAQDSEMTDPTEEMSQTRSFDRRFAQETHSNLPPTSVAFTEISSVFACDMLVDDSGSSSNIRPSTLAMTSTFDLGQPLTTASQSLPGSRREL